jgi:CheY-like chemotaxis protein
MPVMDGLTAVRHIREDEAAGKQSLSLVIALSEFGNYQLNDSRERSTRTD